MYINLKHLNYIRKITLSISQNLYSCNLQNLINYPYPFYNRYTISKMLKIYCVKKPSLCM